MAPILTIICILILVGLGLYLVGLIPMDATIKRIIQVVAIAASVYWVLEKFVPGLPHLI